MPQMGPGIQSEDCVFWENVPRCARFSVKECEFADAYVDLHSLSHGWIECSHGVGASGHRGPWMGFARRAYAGGVKPPPPSELGRQRQKQIPC
jgi:hypothetical protein